MEVMVLASVTVVARHCDAIGALLHVERSISEYIDYSRCWTMARAAAGGHIALLRRLHAAEGNTKHGFSIRDVEQAMELAAQSGHLEVVQFLQVNYPQRGKTWSLELAASYGQLQVLKWLHEHGGGKDCLTMSAFDDAAENGHLEAVKWMHENRSEGCTTRAMDCAARSGRLDIVKWLHDHRKEGCTTQAMDWAAQAGHLDVVQWLHVNRREGCSTMAIDSAAANGHLELLCTLFFFLSSLNFPHDVNRRPLQTQKEPRSSFSPLPTEKKAELLAFRVQITVLQKRLKELEDNAARIGPKPALDETQKRNLITVWTRRAELEKQLRLVAEAQNRQLKTVLARQTQAAKVVRKLLQNVTTVVAIEEGLRTPHPADSGLGRFVPNLDDAIYGELASRMGNMFLDADTVFAKVESKRFITDVVEVQIDPKTGIPYIELRATL